MAISPHQAGGLGNPFDVTTLPRSPPPAVARGAPYTLRFVDF